MKHCKNCENCTKDLLSAYLKGIDYNRCVVDGHHINIGVSSQPVLSSGMPSILTTTQIITLTARV